MIYLCEKRGIEIDLNASIGFGARIGYGARIGDRARIGDGARIGDNQTPQIIYIIGSRFPVSYWGEDRVDIGCQSRTIDEWLTDYQGNAEKYQFTKKEIAEYRSYLTFIKTQHKKAGV